MLKKNIKMLYVELSIFEKMNKYISSKFKQHIVLFSNDSILAHKGCMISYLAFEIGYTA